MNDSKRSFLRNHEFTTLDYVLFFGLSPLLGLPMFYGLIWLMAPFIGIAAPVDAVWMLVVLSLLLSACVGMSISLAMIRRIARKRPR